MNQDSRITPPNLECTPCGACLHSGFDFQFYARDYIYGNDGQWPVSVCRNCGVTLMQPRIPPEDIHAYYPKTYYTNTLSTAPRNDLKTDLQRQTIARYHGYNLGGPKRILTKVLFPIISPLLIRTARMQQIVTHFPNGRILDVGCGNGQRLTIYRDLGWETWGTEVSPSSAKLAEEAGHNISLGTLKEARLEEESFDCVTLWDTLEHIYNPLEELQQACRLLRRGGSIYVYVPNYGSIYARLLRDKWFMFTAPLHYFHYTSKTLSQLLVRSGYVAPTINYPLGAVGFYQSILNTAEDQPSLKRLLQSSLIAKSFRQLEKLLPRGHLLAIARKP